MPEFPLELYRSRTAEIVAQRAEAQAAYEAAALACAFDPSAGGQLEARALVADLDAQQEALDAAYEEFSRQAVIAAQEAAQAAWEVDAEKVAELTADANAKARETLSAMLPTLKELSSLLGETKASVRQIVGRYRFPVGHNESSMGWYNPVRDLNWLKGPKVEAASAVEQLIGAFGELEHAGSAAIDFMQPKLKDAA